MANIHKGKKKLRETSIEDIAMRNVPKKQQVFMQNGKKNLILPQSTQMAVNSKKLKDALDKQIEQRNDYNNKLIELDPLYETLKPIGSFIVRYSLLPIVTNDMGLVINEDRKVSLQTDNGHLKGKIVDPYQFNSVAVIVAMPEHETFLKKGQLCQTVLPKTMTMGDVVVGYEYNYMHPSAGAADITKDITNPHFGYAIIPKQWIKVLLSEDYYETFIKK